MRLLSGKLRKEGEEKRKREIEFGNLVAEDVWHGEQL